MGDVGVEAEGRGHAGMAKHRCYHVRRLAVLEREGGRGMAQGVERDCSYTRLRIENQRRENKVSAGLSCPSGPGPASGSA
jgi:hypothetical protein